MIVLADGTFHGTIGGGSLERLVLEDARRALTQAISEPRRYPLCLKTGQCCGGSEEVFIEIVGLPPLLYVFGAGHVGRAVAETMAGTPFQVHMVDARPDWLAPAWSEGDGVPRHVVRHATDPLAFVETELWDRSRTHVAVMTHDHALDLELVHRIATRPARFIGLIGSATKWARFKQRLGALGAGPDEIQRIHCPIGIATFGKAPKEVAISVAAQLLTLHHER
jgi:xanthine dehydrogenase accessory factor